MTNKTTTIKYPQGSNQFIYINGKLVMKRWLDKDGNKTQPSRLFNDVWPDVVVIDHE